MKFCSAKTLSLRLLAALLAFTAASLARAQPVEIVPVRDAAARQSLDGPWKFRYVAGPVTEADAAFSAAAFDDKAWASIPVPSHWELEGFAEPKYAKVDEGAGYYRRTFQVPAAWRGQRVMLRFDGALYGLEVWVNGTRVGEWASSYNPVTFDITDALKTAADNVLAVRVTTHPKGWEFDTNDCWALSGIYREVTLMAVPPTHFQHYTARTTLTPAGGAKLQLTTLLAGDPAGATVHGKLRAPGGALVQDFTVPLNGAQGETAIEVAQPELWTAETPNLYGLELVLERPGQPAQTLNEKIGLRQISIIDGILCLNGQPVKLRGVDHHDIWPVAGRVATEELMRHDLEMIKGANANFIRTSHYPPHPRFIELCDEMGVYVMDEVPFGFGDNHLTDPSYQDILLTRARATVLRDENHPSVIVWSVGNENNNTPLTLATGARVKELDPSRPICFPQVGSYFGRSYRELPDFVDIYAPHYPEVNTVRSYATQLSRPVIFTEYAHALGLATDRIQSEWAIMQASPRLAGGAVWMFQDQGILRTSEKSADEREANPYVWLDAHHYYDTNQLDGMDGIVYSDRTPQPDYFEVRKVYSPVQIATTSAPVQPGANEVTLPVENRFDFRSLEHYTLEWTVRDNRSILAEGRVPLQAAAHATEQVKIPVKLPDNLSGDFFTLALRCVDEKGNSLYERMVRLEPSAALNPAQAVVQGAAASPLQLTETPDAFVVRHPLISLSLDRHTGELTLSDPAGAVLARGPLPHTGRTRITQTEELRAKADSLWLGSTLSHPADLATTATQKADGITLHVQGKYSRNDIPAQFIVGGFTATLRPTGALEISYEFTPEQADGRMIEAGVSFVAAPAATEFRWVGQGPYPGYPAKDALDEFGIFHLSRDDLYFGGNRRGTEVAVLSTPAGNGFALLSPPADIAVEVTPEGVILSHNAALSSRGNKGNSAEVPLRVSSLKTIAGQFTLLPLGSAWPVALARWVGPPTENVAVQKPFYRSYDQ